MTRKSAPYRIAVSPGYAAVLGWHGDAAIVRIPRSSATLRSERGVA